MQTVRDIGIDVRAMLAPLGSPRVISKKLAEHNIGIVSADVLEKWVERGSIRGAGLYMIGELYRKEGLKFRIKNFVYDRRGEAA